MTFDNFKKILLEDMGTQFGDFDAEAGFYFNFDTISDALDNALDKLASKEEFTNWFISKYDNMSDELVDAYFDDLKNIFHYKPESEEMMEHIASYMFEHYKY